MLLDSIISNPQFSHGRSSHEWRSVTGGCFTHLWGFLKSWHEWWIPKSLKWIGSIHFNTKSSIFIHDLRIFLGAHGFLGFRSMAISLAILDFQPWITHGSNRGATPPWRLGWRSPARCPSRWIRSAPHRPPRRPRWSPPWGWSPGCPGARGKTMGRPMKIMGKYRNMMEIDGTYQKFMKLEKFKGWLFYQNLWCLESGGFLIQLDIGPKW